MNNDKQVMGEYITTCWVGWLPLAALMGALLGFVVGVAVGVLAA